MLEFRKVAEDYKGDINGYKTHIELTPESLEFLRNKIGASIQIEGSKFARHIIGEDGTSESFSDDSFKLEGQLVDLTNQEIEILVSGGESINTLGKKDDDPPRGNQRFAFQMDTFWNLGYVHHEGDEKITSLIIQGEKLLDKKPIIKRR